MIPTGVYEGPFRNGRANGKGHREYVDGSRYDGEYVDDKRVGYGEYTWPDGDKFSGEWRVGRWKGILTVRGRENGEEVERLIEQEWYENEFDKGNKGVY